MFLNVCILHFILDGISYFRRGSIWWRRWECLKAGESNGNLPLWTCLVRSIPEQYRSPDWALVPAKPAQRLNTTTNNNNLILNVYEFIKAWDLVLHFAVVCQHFVYFVHPSGQNIKLLILLTVYVTMYVALMDCLLVFCMMSASCLAPKIWNTAVQYLC
jgi:hypothetical protein